MKKLLTLVSISVGLCTVIPASVSATQGQVESTTFTQQILPLNCIFVTVDTGLNTIRYLTPTECGRIINPSPTNISTEESRSSSSDDLLTQQQNSIFNSAFTQKASAVQSGQQTTSPKQSKLPQGNVPAEDLINNHKQALAINGYDITVTPGQKLTYIPLLSSGDEQRSFTITNVNISGVTVLQEPIERHTELKPNQTVATDPNKIGQSTIAIEVLGTPRGNTAHLRVWLLSSKLTLRDVLQINRHSEKHTWFIVAAMGFAVIITAARFWYHRHRKQ